MIEQKINIIMADDHKLFRQTLCSLLEKHNIFKIADAENGVDLLEILKTKRADVILLDIEMPEMDGSEALEKINKKYPGQKIIIITQHHNEVLMDSFYAKGVKAFLTKNTDFEEVAKTIRLVYENKYVPENLNIKVQKENFPKFSKRESELIPLICEGKSNKEIADQLNIVDKTVEAHKKSLYKKTNTLSVGGFVNYILKKGLNYLR